MRNRGVGLVVALVALLGVGGVVYAIASGGVELFSLNQQAADEEIVVAFREDEYEATIDLADSTLESQPMHPTALVFGGFARFYAGVNQVNVETRSQLIEDSIVFLRRALLLPRIPLEAQAHYVVGKAYYHKGAFFADLTVHHLETARDLGYEADDTYEYLGLAYSQLGDLEASAANFEIAADRRATDLLYLTVAQTYERLGDYDRAETYLLKAIDDSEDDYMRYTSEIELASVLVSDEEYERARDLLDGILEANPRSADAHYFLGIVYDATGNPERARYEWREARRLDPNHHEALQRLGSN